eukprot:TRINITY_DN103509_c0_g1_i1.p1 TRINITY_DN103509_c0_g1~~TRINITY_DN103509_c0_g1_i1.p1  ORF type:complete len:475 (-),score=28.05 TRINITY_DN103509_c0_g1_i1:283-1707(-)
MPLRPAFGSSETDPSVGELPTEYKQTTCFGKSIKPVPLRDQPPPPGPKPKNDAGTVAVVCMIGLVMRAWCWDFEVADWDKQAHFIVFLGCVAELVFWGIVTHKILSPNKWEKQLRIHQLKKALPEAGDTGLTLDWYEKLGGWITTVRTVLFTLTWGGLAVMYYIGYPRSPVVQIHSWWQVAWSWAWHRFTSFELFMGIFLAHFVTLWTLGLAYGYLDVFRPKWALPFKIQEETVITKTDFLHAMAVTFGNSFLTALVGVIVYQFFPYINPHAWDEKIPSIPQIAVQFFAVIPMEEIGFYAGHRLMHLPWFWYHFHYMHHEWKAPIAMATFFTHPIEHLVVSVPVVVAGPILFGFHVSLFTVWAFIATLVICQAHCGWHLPLLPSSEEHDYHHNEGFDNMGALNILDTFYQTNTRFLTKAWQAKIDKRYNTQDYPVQKILARNGQLKKSRHDFVYQEDDTCTNNSENSSQPTTAV